MQLCHLVRVSDQDTKGARAVSMDPRPSPVGRQSHSMSLAASRGACKLCPCVPSTDHPLRPKGDPEPGVLCTHPLLCSQASVQSARLPFKRPCKWDGLNHSHCPQSWRLQSEPQGWAGLVHPEASLLGV